MSFKEHPEWINRNGRGKTRYSYTLDDIARVKGRALQTIRNHVSMGKFKPESLSDVVRYCST